MKQVMLFFLFCSLGIGLWGMNKKKIDLHGRTDLVNTILKGLREDIEELNLSGAKYRYEEQGGKQVELEKPIPFGINELVIMNFRWELTSLNIAYANIDDEFLEWVSDEGSSLELLNLSHTKITDKSVRLIAKKIPKIKTLILQGCDIQGKCLRDKNVFQDMKQLKVLDISSCRKLAPNVLKNIPTELEEIDLSGCMYLESEYERAKSIDGKFIKPLRSCKNLKKLILRATNMIDSCLELMPNRLEELDLSQTKITSKGLIQGLVNCVAKRFTKLKRLIILRFKATDRDLKLIEALRKRRVEVVISI